VASYAILLLVRALGSVDTNADAVYVVHFLAAYNSALCVAIAAAGGIPSLVALLESMSVSVQKRAVGLLINLSANAENMVTIVSARVGFRLSSRCLNHRRFACRSLLRVHCVQPERECREQSHDRVSRGIPPLIALLASPSVIVQGNAAGALRNVSKNVENMVTIAGASGIRPLIALLASPSAGCNRRRLLACCSS
jgi:hypothetical protein